MPGEGDTEPSRGPTQTLVVLFVLVPVPEVRPVLDPCPPGSFESRRIIVSGSLGAPVDRCHSRSPTGDQRFGTPITPTGLRTYDHRCLVLHGDKESGVVTSERSLTSEKP